MSNEPEEKPDGPQEEELSLRSLSQAFAEALARQRAADDMPQEQPDAEQEASDSDQPRTDESTESTAQAIVEPPVEEEPKAEEEDSCPVNPRTILEAMLFVGDPENRPLDVEQAASLMRGVEPEDIPVLVEELNESYRQEGCPYRVASDGAGFRLTLDESFHRVRERFRGRVRMAKLSQAAIDVLAIVAYRQPLKADEVTQLRGKPSHHILSQLVRRRLLRIERPKEKPRKSLYHTTDRFLELFELTSLADLPESEALERD